MAQADDSEWYAKCMSSGDEIWHRQMIVNGMPNVSHQEMRYGTIR